MTAAASPLLYTAHVPPGDGPFPTIVLLHGWGASAHDLFGLAPHIHRGRALVLCPQGAVIVPFGGGENGYGWFPLTPGAPPDIDAFRHAADQVRAFVDLARTRYPVDPQAIAIAGFSQGGMMAYELALRDPARYSGLAALSAYLPEPLIEDLPRLPEQKDLPVLVIHGTSDSQISVDKARQSREALRAFEVSLTYREFDMAHEIRPDALRVFTRWVDDRAFRRAGTPAAPAAT
jgi:phospholipase/carboxylesterase